MNRIILAVLTTAALTAMAIMACNKDSVSLSVPESDIKEHTENERPPESASRASWVSREQVPHIIKHIRRHFADLRIRSGGTLLRYDSLHLDYVYQVSNDTGTVNTYTILVGDTDSMSFYNVVVEEFVGEELSAPAVMEYTMTSDFRNDFLQGVATLGEFQGTMRRYAFFEAFDSLGLADNADNRDLDLEICWEIVFDEVLTGVTGSGVLNTSKLPTVLTNYWWGPSGNFGIPGRGFPAGTPTQDPPCYIEVCEPGETYCETVIVVKIDEDCNGIPDDEELGGSGGIEIETRNPTYEECYRLFVQCGIIPGCDLIDENCGVSNSTGLYDLVIQNLDDILGLTTSERFCLGSSDANKKAALDASSFLQENGADQCSQNLANEFIDLVCSGNSPGGIKQMIHQDLLDDGYIPLELDDITVEPYQAQSGPVEQTAKITVDIQGDIVDVNEDIVSFMTSIVVGLTDIKGTVRSIGKCEDLPAITGEKGELIEDRSPINYVYELDVLTTVELTGEKRLYLKTSESIGELPENQGDPTVYVLFLPDALTLNQQDIVDGLETFYDQIGLPDLNVSAVTNIHPESVMRRHDALALVGGNPSELVALAIGTYCDFYPEGDWPLNGSRIQTFMTNPASIELASAHSHQTISMTNVGNMDQDARNAFKVTTNEELTSFIVFHATGHNSGITHPAGTSGPNDGQGFMQSAPCITRDLGAWPSSCGSFPDPDPAASLGELVDETPQWVKNYMITRFDPN
ncbi:MAG: hypothetical protein R3301_10070 [Saprospiraceae bacterium]|nr:hypothetical protein [Saprospiraceae bacterium]